MKKKENHNKIWEAIDDIKINHLTHLSIDMAETKTNVAWLKKNHFIIMSASVGALIAALINLL